MSKSLFEGQIVKYTVDYLVKMYMVQQNNGKI